MGNKYTNASYLKELGRASNKSVKTFSFEGYKGFAKVVKVYDGDTCTCVFKPKMRRDDPMIKCRIRMERYDAPELKAEMGKEARDFLAEMIMEKVVWMEMKKNDKWGRILAEIWLNKGDSKSVNDLMLESKYAKPYNGKGKKFHD